jgi:hypothetical protein
VLLFLKKEVKIFILGIRPIGLLTRLIVMKSESTEISLVFAMTCKSSHKQPQAAKSSHRHRNFQNKELNKFSHLAAFQPTAWLLFFHYPTMNIASFTEAT